MICFFYNSYIYITLIFNLYLIKSMNKYALTVENLTKVYSDSKNKKENKALNNLNFQVKQGEVFGLLGPNGPEDNFFKYFGWNCFKN